MLAGSRTGRTAAALIANERLAVPAHFDAEVYSAFRRHFRQGLLTRQELDRVTAHIVGLAAERVPLLALFAAAHVLSDRLSAVDVFCVVLARVLRDHLAAAPGCWRSHCPLCLRANGVPPALSSRGLLCYCDALSRWARTRPEAFAWTGRCTPAIDGGRIRCRGAVRGVLVVPDARPTAGSSECQPRRFERNAADPDRRKCLDRGSGELVPARFPASRRFRYLLVEPPDSRKRIVPAGLGVSRFRSYGPLLAGSVESSRARRCDTRTGRGRRSTHPPQWRDRCSSLGRMA